MGMTDQEKKNEIVLVMGVRVMVAGIWTLALMLLWIIAFNLYDKNHLARSISLSALSAILAVIIVKKGIIDIISGKNSGTDKYSLGYQ